MSAVITPFQGTETFNTASFNNRISEINTGFSYVSNPNLLDNWYFANPVNQRGQTEYTGAWSYTIDRWFLGGEPYNAMEITDEGIHVSYTQPGWNVIQKLENVLCKGNTYTFSAVYKSTLPLRLVVSFGDNKYFFNESSPATSEWALATITGTVPNDVEITYEQVVFQQLGSVAGTMDIKASKLERGPTQTLAHKEGERWVLNEVPDYGEQLRRCQRDYLRIKASSAYMRFGVSTPYTDTSAGAFIQFPNQMRAVPVLSFGGNFALFDGDQFHSVTLSSDTMSPYNATLRLTGSTQPTKGAQLLAYNDDNAYIAFSADL